MVLPLEAILSKSADMVVGGVASNFFRDLDGDAICPDAIQRAIPGFMATRGPDGLKGGPIRLHHGFWERFLKQSISALNIPYDQQVGLLAAIALPLGRVTEMSVDSDGTTRWRGVLSGANPIARVVWNMLKEGMVHLGVSVGGKINGVRPGRDAIGRTCNLITDVRLDELSITDNPANRLIESETPDNGAYITALAKSVGNTMLARQQHYIYLNGIAYTAHPSEEHGIVLRKAGRRRQPSPGQLGLFGGHNEGDTKVEDGVTYRLNANSRWERMDKPKASGKPSGGKKKAEKPAIVPVVEGEKGEAKPEAVSETAADDGAAPTWEDVPQLFESGDYEKIPQALGVDPRYGLPPRQASRFLNILGIKEAKAKKILGQGYLEQERKEYPGIQLSSDHYYELDKLVDAINEAKAFKGVKALQTPKAERPKRELKEEELTLTDNDWKRLAKLKGAMPFSPNPLGGEAGAEPHYWVPYHAIKDAEYLKRKLGFSIKEGSSIEGANFVMREDVIDNVLGYIIKPKSTTAAQDPEPTVGEMLEQQQAAIADEPMPEGEAMEGADDGAMPEEYSEAGITPSEYKAIQKYEARRDKFVSDNLKRLGNSDLNSNNSEYLEQKQYYERTFEKTELAKDQKKKGFNWDKWERTHPPTDRIARRHWLGKLEMEAYEKQKKRRSLNKTGLPMTIDNFLRKALGNPGREFGSGSWRDTGIPAMGRKVDAKSPQPKGGKKVQMDESGSAHAGKGIGGKQPKAHRPYSSGGMPPTDVFGITITQLTRNLAKACYMDKDAWGSPETVSFLTDSARAIAGMTDTPTDPMVNFVRFLQYCTRFAQELPFMNDYQAAGTVKAMNADLTKALDEFVEKMPEELKGKPLRPAGSPGVVGIDVQFPQQYVIYS